MTLYNFPDFSGSPCKMHLFGKLDFLLPCTFSYHTTHTGLTTITGAQNVIELN